MVSRWDSDQSFVPPTDPSGLHPKMQGPDPTVVDPIPTELHVTPPEARNRSLVIAVFEERRHAQEAIESLRRIGIHQDQIGVAVRDPEGHLVDVAATYATADDLPVPHSRLRPVDPNAEGVHPVGAHPGMHPERHTGEGALIGAATGVGLGSLWAIGIAAGMVPAIGPAIAGGILGSLVTSALTGGAALGMLGALVGLGVPEEEAHYYEWEFQKGNSIVTVHAGERYDEIAALLRYCGGRVDTPDSARPVSS